MSVATPFHKYTTVAPLDTHSDTSDSESDNEWHQLDDSGYHKNKMAMVSVSYDLFKLCPDNATNGITMLSFIKKFTAWLFVIRQ